METGTRIAVRVALLGRIGQFGTMPGTVATALVGIPVAAVLAIGSPPWTHGVLAVLFGLACWAAGVVEREYGRSDPREIVVDELVGFLVTMVGLPPSLLSFAVGFLAFRFFDICKPWPVSVLDRQLHGGLGIVLDDVAAGMYAHALVWLVLWIHGTAL